jgi:hypothetical protein
MPYPLFPVIVILACVTAWQLGMPWWLGLGAWVLSPRHFAYVGESSRVRSRKLDHLKGSVKFNQPPKPWVDLRPSHYFIPVPGFKPVLLAIETAGILLLWPVYNHQKNLWNPRRIPLKTALRQRGSRDFTGFWSFNFRPAHALLWVLAGLVFMMWRRHVGMMS